MTTNHETPYAPTSDAPCSLRIPVSRETILRRASIVAALAILAIFVSYPVWLVWRGVEKDRQVLETAEGVFASPTEPRRKPGQLPSARAKTGGCWQQPGTWSMEVEFTLAAGAATTFHATDTVPIASATRCGTTPFDMIEQRGNCTTYCEGSQTMRAARGDMEGVCSTLCPDRFAVGSYWVATTRPTEGSSAAYARR